MILFIDGETTKAPNHFPYMPGSAMVQFGAMTAAGEHYSWLFNHPEATQSIRKNLNELQSLIDKAAFLVAHNAKFELMWLKAMGIRYDHCKIWCTQVSQYQLEGQKSGPKGYYSLDGIAERRGLPLKLDRVAEYWEAGLDTHEIPADTLIEYNRRDNEITAGVYRQQVREFKATPEIHEPLKIQLAMIDLLAEIETNGLKVDQDLLKQFNDEYTQIVAKYNQELIELAGVEINWGSSIQRSALLFGGEYTVDEKETYLFHYKDPKKKPVWKTRNIKTTVSLEGMGFTPPRGRGTPEKAYHSTDINVIKGLKPKTKEQKRFLQILEERGKAEKLRSTYFEGLQTKIVEGFIHPSMNQTVTANSRLSSSNPKHHWGCKTL